MRPIHLLAALTFLIGIPSCGGSADGTSQRSTLPDTTVRAEAEKDAARLNRVAGNENATVAVMLDIRAKEALMRAHSLDATADLYISTIEQLADCPND